MKREEIPIDAYEKLPRFFYLVNCDPAKRVATVKQAGMKYITIACKHHDGFTMYHSTREAETRGYDHPAGLALKREGSVFFVVKHSRGEFQLQE